MEMISSVLFLSVVGLLVKSCEGGIVFSCLNVLDLTRRWRLLNVVDTSASMAGRLPQLTEADGVLQKVFQATRIDFGLANHGMVIAEFQDKNVAPFGDAGDDCDSKVTGCKENVPTSSCIWTSATASGGGDEANDQLGAIHHRTRRLDPSEVQGIVVLYTDSRPHNAADGPSGYGAVPASGNYDCQTTRYPTLEELNDRLVSAAAHLVAIVDPDDVHYYRDLFSSLSTPYVVKPWGQSRQETLNTVLTALNRVVCGADGNSPPAWDKIKKAESHVRMSASNVKQYERGQSGGFERYFGIAMGGNTTFLGKRYDDVN